jgi:hypothetical protein
MMIEGDSLTILGHAKRVEFIVTYGPNAERVMGAKAWLGLLEERTALLPDVPYEGAFDIGAAIQITMETRRFMSGLTDELPSELRTRAESILARIEELITDNPPGGNT